ncbi:cytochrome P450 [Paxillus ammoniavirescens]|nr:cytochrome P450 [Paxillus ammoniavirescens]
MTPPGLAFLKRVTLLSLSYCLVGAAFARIAALLYGSSIPTCLLLPWLLACLPLGFALKVLCTDLFRKYEAASMGARPMPVIKGERFGNIDLMLNLLEHFETGYPVDGMTDAVAGYGNCYNFRVMFDDLLFTCEPNHIKAILATDFDNFVKGNRFRATMLNVLGTGVFNSDGEMWKFHRSMTRPFFSHDRISHFNIFDRYAEDVINQMKSRLRAGYPVDFQDAISRFTLDSATEFLFGSCVHSLSAGLPYPHNVTPVEAPTGSAEIANDFARAFSQAQVIVSQRVRRSWLWPLFEPFGDKTEEPMKIVNAYIEPILKDAIEKRKMVVMRGEKPSDELSDDDTLLDHLVQQTTDPVVLKDEILNIMIAGRDTTAGTLTFVIYFLSTHPHVLARLRDEIMTKIGPTDRPTHASIRELKYLRAVINETLRLFPPVPLNIRQSIKATTLPSSDPLEKPRYVSANTPVSYSAFIMHRRKDLWGPDAEEFDPDRFLDDRLHKYLTPQPFIFLPFNAGPRICLGQQFAYNEISFMLIRLLQHFTSMSLAQEAQAPGTLPPAAWAEADGRKAREKCFPKMHLTMYAHGGLWVGMTEADDQIM